MAALTRKHFVKAAALIKETRETDPAKADALAATFVDFFRGQNPRFDVNRFLQASGAK